MKIAVTDTLISYIREVLESKPDKRVFTVDREVMELVLKCLKEKSGV